MASASPASSMERDLRPLARTPGESETRLEDRLWHAVLARDSSFDGRFVFAVRSTRIYCRPSCPAKRPRRDRTLFYPRPEDAERDGFRACLRCEPRLFSDAQVKRRLDGELALARLVQERLAPRDMPRLEGWDVAGVMEPCREVGGDFFDVVKGTGDSLVLGLGDVSGKGVGAALLAASLQTAFRLTAGRETRPSRLLSVLNADLVARTPGAVYATLAVVVLHADGCLWAGQAGHPRPLVVAPGRPTRRLDASGPPLGLLAHATYPDEESRVPPRGTILLYSDGVSEATDARGRELGPDALAAAVSDGTGGSARARLEALRRLVLAHASGAPSDDRSLLLACRGPAPSC